MPCRKYMRCSIGKPAMQQRAGQKNNPREDSDPMQLGQCPSDYIAREMSIRKYFWNLKCSGREHESEKNQPADPDHE